MSSFRVLSPDIQYTDGGIIEKEVANKHLQLDPVSYTHLTLPTIYSV